MSSPPLQDVESGTPDHNMACQCYTFLFDNNHKKGLHWFLCAPDCRFTIWFWDSVSSISFMHPLLKGLKALKLATEHKA